MPSLQLDDIVPMLTPARDHPEVCEIPHKLRGAIGNGLRCGQILLQCPIESPKHALQKLMHSDIAIFSDIN